MPYFSCWKDVGVLQGNLNIKWPASVTLLDGFQCHQGKVGHYLR